MSGKKVAIVMGSKSDYPVVEKAVELLEQWGVEYEIRILSAHRTPDETGEFAKGAVERNVGAIIAAAGKAAALPGAIAAITTVPVIGLPIKSSFMDGLDSLLSMVQMPSGIPVATVGVNAAENAALLAIQILALGDEALAKRLMEYKVEMKNKVLDQDASMR